MGNKNLCNCSISSIIIISISTGLGWVRRCVSGLNWPGRLTYLDTYFLFLSSLSLLAAISARAPLLATSAPAHTQEWRAMSIRCGGTNS